MLRPLAARLVSMLATLLAVVTGAFFLMRAAPGGPFDLERPLDPLVLENLRRIYKLDEPLWRQYLDYLGALLHGDFGPSYVFRDISVNELFAKALPVSARLAAIAIVVALLVGVAAGAFAAAARARSTGDFAVTTAATIGMTLPNFVVAPLLQLVFGLWLKALPIGGWNDGAAQNLVLPAATLALPQIAVIARLTRAAMIEALGAPATRTALAYGLPQRVIFGRAFRSALLPLISYLGPASAALLTGSVVVETIFALPGPRPLFRRGGAEPRLHPGDGHRGAGRVRRHRRQRRRRRRLHARRSAHPSWLSGLRRSNGFAAIVWRSAPRLCLLALALFAFLGPFFAPVPFDKAFPAYVKAAPSLAAHPDRPTRRAPRCKTSPTICT